VVTGGARGIGAETARRLVSRGMRVALLDVNGDGVERTARELGPDAHPIAADITDPEAVERAVAETVERFGGIDVCMANAGVGAFGSARTIDPAAFEGTIEVNLLGNWRTVRACLPHVIERRGYVLVVASVAAMLQAPAFNAYGASKAGIEAFANSLRQEVRHLGVDVGVAYYSWIATNLVTQTESENAGFAALRAEMQPPLHKTYPTSQAADATLRGIERRARQVAHPRWLVAFSLLRGVLQPLVERQYRETAQRVVDAAESDVARRGSVAASTIEDRASEAQLEAGRR
jgi:NAD(P)-dependent dehydrogenase (short-subunit alcohol dehydrogenase family)